MDRQAYGTDRAIEKPGTLGKALELEEKLAHEREKVKGKDLQMVENLEHQTQRESTSNDDDAALTTVTDQTITGDNVCECRLMGQAAYKLTHRRR